MAENKTQEPAREYTNFERLVIEYIAFNDGFINTRLRAQRMLDESVSEPMLGNQQDLKEFAELQEYLWRHHKSGRPAGRVGLAGWALAALKFHAASAPTLGETNAVNIAVDMFAQAMKEKMADAHAKGRSGWERMSPSDLSRMLREHVEKGDPRDVANFCMMLWHHSAQIASQPQAAEPKGLTDEAQGPKEGKLYCLDCACMHPSEYMATSAVWACTGLDYFAGSLCLNCLTKRIGRPLTLDDFPDVPINGAVRYGLSIAGLQPMTDSARDVQDAKRYRLLRERHFVRADNPNTSAYHCVGVFTSWLPAPTIDREGLDAVLDAEIERLERAKGE